MSDNEGCQQAFCGLAWRRALELGRQIHQSCGGRRNPGRPMWRASRRHRGKVKGRPPYVGAIDFNVGQNARRAVSRCAFRYLSAQVARLAKTRRTYRVSYRLANIASQRRRAWAPKNDVDAYKRRDSMARSPQASQARRPTSRQRTRWARILATGLGMPYYTRALLGHRAQASWSKSLSPAGGRRLRAFDRSKCGKIARSSM